MSVNISIWAIVALPLTLLVWLHRVRFGGLETTIRLAPAALPMLTPQLYSYVVALLTWDRGLTALWARLHGAETFEEWEAAGLALDHRYRIDAWRRVDKSADYAWELIGDRLAALALARQAGHVQAVVHLLQSGLVRNLGHITEPALYNASFAGTKFLIENYVLQVCESIRDLVVLPVPGAVGSDGDASAPTAAAVAAASAAAAGLSPELARAVADGRCGRAQLLPLAAKRQLMRNLRQSFGRTTLVFQGGSVFGACHIGVARALFMRGLLPRIITGTGTGALVAALVATHTDDELPAVLDGVAIDLSAFAARAGHRGGLAKEVHKDADDADKNLDPRWATIRRRLARLWHDGYLLDAGVLEQSVRDNCGDMTFAEAYRRTGRTLNITVAAAGAAGAAGDVPSVLNYVTAPDVLIWTAAVASNANASSGAADAAWYSHRPTTILCRRRRPDADSDEIVPWPLADAARFRHWSYGSDGASHSRHSPLQRIAQLFNVNHFVVSQARPYLLPFLEPSLHSPAMRGFAMGTIARANALAWRTAGRFTRHRLEQLARLGCLPLAVSRLLLDEQIPGGDEGRGGGGGSGARDPGAGGAGARGRGTGRAPGRAHARGRGVAATSAAAAAASGRSLVLVPTVPLRDYLRLLDAPSPASLQHWIRKGEKAVWPAVAALKIRCSIELALEQACHDLEASSSMAASALAAAARTTPVPAPVSVPVPVPVPVVTLSPAAHAAQGPLSTGGQ